MTDRQDIDALLIGSLYGELSSTEEARLAAHLESHPQDRTALADLTWAREAVRESRILQVQFEPPQSISALLLQEAHRRAPKPKEEQSWFQRFMRSFMLHPAMAAAAMLVLIVGVAGTLYVRKGDHFAHQTKSEAPTQTADQSVMTPPAAPAIVAGADAGAQVAQDPADNFAVRLDDVTTKSEQAADKNVEAKKKSKPTKPTELAFEGSLAKEAKPEPPPPVANKPAPKKPAAKSYIEVTTPDRAPKDLDPPKTTVARTDGAKRDENVGTTTLSTGAAGGAGAPSAPTPAPSVAAQPPPAEAEKQNDPLLAWAKEQHAKVIAQVKAGKCDAAAKIALGIANRASAYYAANVKDDIAIKGCKTYIEDQREREAERTQRAKATAPRRAEEPAKASDSSK